MITVEGVTLSIIVGVLAAIVYSLRILVILERRIARMDLNLASMVKQVMQEEMKIEKAVGIKKKKN
jgi:hypothetical protein